MKRNFSVLITAISFCVIIFTSCEKDPKNKNTEIKEADEINTFIWTGLHDYYLWEENVPRLTDSYYVSNTGTNTDSLNNFLNKYSDHEALFYDLLYDYGHTDKWSWVVSDYVELEKEFEGITKSMGYNFIPALYGTDGKVLGVVSYIVKGSPADLAGIKRGDIFTQVDGQQLTRTNFSDLLFGSGSDSYALSFASVINNTLTLNGKTANLTAVEVNEDPIYLDSVYTVNNQKIGYLIYNSFTAPYDKELNNVFLKFKNEGISKLILDFRYNGGGSVQTAIYLASMIYGTYTNKIFLQTHYNDLLQSYFQQKNGPDYFNIKFESDIVNEDESKTPINTLNLSDVYIITTPNTASASECIINGLKPYMNVVTVGDTTHGKYVASMTINDYIDNNGTINPNHKWALQPITLKISNSSGVSDFVDGLFPNVKITEDLTNLSVLGDLNEPLLNKAISAITGISAKSEKLPSGMQLQRLALKKESTRKMDMYFNKGNLSFQDLKRK